jgi:hypothetical protein
MNVVINGPQFFLLLDSIFSDLSVNKIRSLNPTYIIKYNDEEIFHYENGVVNVGLDFINKVKSFVPVKIDKEFVINVGKWIRSKTGLKPRTIWIGLKQYNVGPHLNESENKPMKKFNRDNNPDKGKYGKLIEDIAYSYFKNPDDVCDIICIKTGPSHEGLGEYILLVLMSYSMSETKLSEYIKGFVPIDVMVLIQTSYHCKDED